MFQGELKESLTVKMKVRLGMEKFVCHIDVKDHALP